MRDDSGEVHPTRVIAAWGPTERIQYHGPDDKVRTHLVSRNQARFLPGKSVTWQQFSPGNAWITQPKSCGISQPKPGAERAPSFWQVFTTVRFFGKQADASTDPLASVPLPGDEGTPQTVFICFT